MMEDNMPEKQQREGVHIYAYKKRENDSRHDPSRG